MKRIPLLDRVIYCFLALVLIVGSACNPQVRAPEKEKFSLVQNIPPNIERWEKEIDALEAKDEEAALEEEPIVFVGSSSIVMWKSLASDFADKTTLNRGFGGSQTDEVHFYAFRTLIPYKPKQVVIYVGDNDIAAGKTPERVFADLKDFFDDIRYRLPKTKITFIAIKPSPSRWKLMEEFTQTNLMVKDYLKTLKNASYVDIVKPMLMENGRPNPSYFLSDSLHMSDAGYEVWKKALAHHLE